MQEKLNSKIWSQENLNNNEEIIISPRSATNNEAIKAIEAKHLRDLEEIDRKHGEELQHTLQYKFLFAQLASKKEDLELALEVEKNKTRKSRIIVEKCLKTSQKYEQQEQQLAETVARLAHQLIEAGIPIKGEILSGSGDSSGTSTTASTSSTSTTPGNNFPSTNSLFSSSLAGDFSLTERNLMMEILSEEAENSAKFATNENSHQTPTKIKNPPQTSAANIAAMSPTSALSPSKWWPWKKPQQATSSPKN